MEDLKDFLKSLSWLIVASLIIIGLALYFFLPRLKEYQKIRKEIKTQETKITKLTQKLNDLNALSEKELQDNLNLAMSSLPAEKDFFQVIEGIKNIFGQEGILLSDFKFNVGDVSTASAEAGKSKTKEQNFFTINLSFLGTEEKTQMAVSRLEKSLPLLSVESIKFLSENASSSGQFETYLNSMTLRSYFSPLPKNLGSVDSPLPKIGSEQKKQLEVLSQYEVYQALQGEVATQNVFVGRENPFPSY